jgi:hypothetical protein
LISDRAWNSWTTERNERPLPMGDNERFNEVDGARSPNHRIDSPGNQCSIALQHKHFRRSKISVAPASPKNDKHYGLNAESPIAINPYKLTSIRPPETSAPLV